MQEFFAPKITNSNTRRVLSRFTPRKARDAVTRSHAAISHIGTLEGEQLRFPPSNARFAHCLPFSGFRPATKGSYPLGTPLICQANQKSCSIRSSDLSGDTDLFMALLDWPRRVGRF